MTRTPVRAVCSQTIVQLFIPSCSGLAVPFLPRGEMTFPLEFDDRVKEKKHHLSTLLPHYLWKLPFALLLASPKSMWIVALKYRIPPQNNNADVFNHKSGTLCWATCAEQWLKTAAPTVGGWFMSLKWLPCCIPHKWVWKQATSTNPRNVNGGLICQHVKERSETRRRSDCGFTQASSG